MKVIVVDDERLALENLVRVIKRVEPKANVASFQESKKALDYLRENEADVAFLDIEMDGLSGLLLAKTYKEHCPTINIIFVTGHAHYMADAFKMHVSGYLLKPVREPDLRMELDNLRYPLNGTKSQKVRIQTFGNFEVFVNEKLLDFPREKSKECLAYLIDRRGARVSVPDLAAVLWEDRPNGKAIQNSVYQAVFTLRKVLEEAGISEILIKGRGKIAIDVNKVDCDYYAAINGDTEQFNRFVGEYMKNYSWAEFTLGELVEKRVKFQKEKS